MRTDWKHYAVLLLTCVASVSQAAEAPPSRELEPMEQYVPRVDGDKKFSNTYRYWKDRAKLDPTLAGNPEEFWRLNWKFMDPPFNQAVPALMAKPAPPPLSVSVNTLRRMRPPFITNVP